MQFIVRTLCRAGSSSSGVIAPRQSFFMIRCASQLPPQAALGESQNDSKLVKADSLNYNFYIFTSRPNSSGRNRGQTFSEDVITEAASMEPISMASAMVLW